MDKEKALDDFFDIDEKVYDWSINLVRTVIKMLKVNIKLHADPLALSGDIILCNHFSRFETLIPQYLLYEETGVYCCAIASSEFFKEDSLLADYLNNVGVIAHDHDNLFSSLARQVFLGRKIIIFPEGGMVKDRRVLDHQGNYSIFSRVAGERRKQHTGAAVLAQGIEAFKATIRNAYNNKEYDKLLNWKEQLKLDSIDQLLVTAIKPTLITPSNITFYPIRSSENSLLKAVQMFSEGLTKRQTEELLVEGNIMLKDTDLDLHMGKPIDPYDSWHWWNRYVLDMVSADFNSLEQVFSLYQSPKNCKQKLLGYYFKKSVKATRNQYMEDIYANLTINLSHLASTLIMYCMKHDIQQINKVCFYKTLYISIKNLQKIKKVNLHRSLLNPEEYNDLIEGKSKRFEHFISVAESSGLISIQKDNFVFSASLCNESDFDAIRIENLIAVYSNEAEPITFVLDSVIDAYQQCAKLSNQKLAEWQFDDELISLKWDKQRYSIAKYKDVNEAELADQSPSPFLLQPSNSNGIGILLVHGLLASPAEVKEYAESLFRQGYTVFAIRLKGHGTSPYDLREQRYENWYESVERGLKIICAYCDSVVAIGFSTGGGLVLKLAAEKKQNLQAVIAISVPLKFVDKSFLFVPFLHGTNRLIKWVSSIEGIKPFLENISEHPSINYKNVPVKSLYELRRLNEDIEAHLQDINIPTLIVYADEDPVVDSQSARLIFEKLVTLDKRIITISSQKHGILMENIGGLWKEINVFLKHFLL